MNYEIICSVCKNKEILKTDRKYIDLVVSFKCSKCGTEQMKKGKINFNNGSVIEIIPSENVTRGKQSENIQWIDKESPRITIEPGTSGTPLIK